MTDLAGTMQEAPHDVRVAWAKAHLKLAAHWVRSLGKGSAVRECLDTIDITEDMVSDLANEVPT